MNYIRETLIPQYDASIGITLIFAFISLTGILGIDKFYTGNYIIGMIQSILTISIIGYPISLIINIFTIVGLLILIFFNYNILFYTSFVKQPTDGDYFIALTLCIYIILKGIIIYNKYRTYGNKKPPVI